jgi:hypothetical protein
MAANKAAVDAIPADGPLFLANYRDWIAATGPLPDTWRYPSDPHNKEAPDLVKSQLTKAAVLLRDLTYTAWLQSAEPLSTGKNPKPIDPANPAYNPATGSAPPAGPAIPNAN